MTCWYVRMYIVWFYFSFKNLLFKELSKTLKNINFTTNYSRFKGN